MNKLWSDFPVLLAVAETGSLTAAAQQLRLSQPTAGRRIRALEEHFGAALLEKAGGLLTPTPFGEAVVARVLRMREEADAIERASASMDEKLAGVITLSSSEGIGDMWLPGVMQAFRREHPHICIEVVIDSRAVNLARREADIALRWMGPGAQNSLVGRKVLAAGFGLYAAKNYLQERGRPLTPQDLPGHDAAMVNLGGASVFWPEELAGEALRPAKTSFSSNSFNAHIQALIAGYGIGVMAHCTWRALAGSDMLERVLPDINIMEDLWVVAHEDLRKNARIRAVYDYLVEALLRDRDFFETGASPHFARQNKF